MHYQSYVLTRVTLFSKTVLFKCQHCLRLDHKYQDTGLPTLPHENLECTLITHRNNMVEHTSVTAHVSETYRDALRAPTPRLHYRIGAAYDPWLLKTNMRHNAHRITQRAK